MKRKYTEKDRKRRKLYYEAHKEEVLRKMAEYYQKNKIRIGKRAVKYREKHREEINAKRRTPEFRKKINAATRQRRKRNQERQNKRNGWFIFSSNKGKGFEWYALKKINGRCFRIYGERLFNTREEMKDNWKEVL